MEQRRDLVERIPASVMEVARRLHGAGHAAYVVGGAVRDLLLGRTPADWDVATSARPEEVMRLFSDHRLLEVGLRHGSITIVISEEGGPLQAPREAPRAPQVPRAPRAPRAVEVTTFRVEGPYSDRRRPDYVRFVSTLHEDLSRRDFSVNALALDPFTARVHDPWQGRADIEAGVVRAVGNAEERFQEDALRIVRAVRLVAEFGWHLHPATAEAMVACRHLVEEVAAERVRVELERILVAPHVDVALHLATELGLWPFTTLAPPPRQPDFLSQLSKLPPRLELRLAALLATHPDPKAVLARLRFPGEMCRRVAHIVCHLLPEPPLHWSSADIRRWVARVGRAYVPDVLALGRLQTGRVGAWDEFSRRVSSLMTEGFPTTVHDLTISGEEVMHILDCPPGPRVGEVLARLLELVWEDPKLNDPETLCRLAARMR